MDLQFILFFIDSIYVENIFNKGPPINLVNIGKNILSNSHGNGSNSQNISRILEMMLITEKLSYEFRKIIYGIIIFYLNILPSYWYIFIRLDLHFCCQAKDRASLANGERKFQ